MICFLLCDVVYTETPSRVNVYGTIHLCFWLLPSPIILWSTMFLSSYPRPAKNFLYLFVSAIAFWFFLLLVVRERNRDGNGKGEGCP